MDSSTMEEQPIEDILNEILDDDGTADPEFSGGREGEGDEEDFFLDNPCDETEEGAGNMLNVSAEVVEESEEVSDSVQLEEQPSNGHKSEDADIKPSPTEEVNQISRDNLSKGGSSKIIRIKRTFPSPAGDLQQPARKVVKIQPQPKAREGIPDSLDQVILNEDGKQRVEKFIKKCAGSTGGNTNNQANGRVVTNDIPSRVTKDLREKITKKETGNSPQKGQIIPTVVSSVPQAVRLPAPITGKRPLLTSQPIRPLVRLPPRQPPPIRQPGGPQFPRHEFRPQPPVQNQRPPNPSNFPQHRMPPPQSPRPVSMPPRPAPPPPPPPPVKTIHVNPHFKDKLPIPLAIGNSQSQPSQPPFPQHHLPQSHQQNFTSNQNFYPHQQQQHVQHQQQCQQQQTWNNPQQHQYPSQQHFEQSPSYAYEEYGQLASEAVYDYPQHDHSGGMYSEKSQFDNQQHSLQHFNYQQQQSSQAFNDGSNVHQRQHNFPPNRYPPQPSTQQQPFPQRPSHPQRMQGPPQRFQWQPGPPRPLQQQPQQFRPMMRAPIQPQERFQGPHPPLQHPPQQQQRFMRPPQSMNRMPVPQNPNFNQNPPTPLQQPRFQNPPGQMRPMRPQGPLQPAQPRMAPMWVATPQGPRMVPPARPPFRPPHPQQLPPRGGPPFRPHF